MKFLEAINSGKPVRRACWGITMAVERGEEPQDKRGRIVVGRGGVINYWSTRYDRWVPGNVSWRYLLRMKYGIGFEFRLEDFNADDWEFYEGEWSGDVGSNPK